MALDGASLKAKLATTLHTALKRELGADVSKGKNYLGIADAQLQKLANAISDIAIDLVTEIQTQAEVVAGIPVATSGSPSAQTGTTVGTGKIL